METNGIMGGSIVLCERQCWGFEHASFNAAVLQTVLVAYPEARVAFLGEREHLQWVQTALAQQKEDDQRRVDWVKIELPPKTLGNWWRLAVEWCWCSRMFRIAAEQRPRFLLLCSATSEGLLALKLLMTLRRARFPVLVLLHGTLAKILGKQSRRPWYWLTNIRQVLRFPYPRRLRCLVLGEPILRSLTEILPRVAAHFVALDPPYLWTVNHPRSELSSGQSVRFGFLGVSTHKGFDVFARLAKEVRDVAPQAAFTLVGFVRTADEVAAYNPVVEGVSTTPLSLDEYAARAYRLTYVVSTIGPERNRLVASATFLDALAYVKPGIYLRNPYIEHYFERMGDIGYLCDTYDEMKTVMLSILNAFPVERYRRQCENILYGREVFAPQTVASRLREIVSECGRQYGTGAQD